MARPLRIHLPGTVYHLFARGDDKATIFRDDRDCTHFLEVLGAALQRFDIACVTYCLISTHYHLLAVRHAHSVSRLMQQLNGEYCQWFNRRHGRIGHVLQGRFGSRIVGDESYLLTALRYVVMNPVAAGFVPRPEDWKWSSYRATAGLCAAPPWLTLEGVWTALGCEDSATGRERYIAHVTAGTTPDDYPRVLVFGSDLLARQVRPELTPHRENGDFVYAERFATRPPLADILEDADSTPALQRAVRDAFHRHAYTLREIGAMIGRTPSTISKWIRKADAAENTGGRTRTWHQKIGGDKFKI